LKEKYQMRFLSLTDSEAAQLNRVRKRHQSFRVRDRAHAILLSHKDQKIDDIASIFEVNRDTVSDWFTRWESDGLSGLQDTPGRGRKPKLAAVKKKSSKS